MLKIMAVCGAGLGSSFVAQMSIERVMKKLGVDAKVDHTDVASIGGFANSVDLIVVASTYEKQIRGKVPADKPLVFLKSLVDVNEIESRVSPVLKGMGVIS